MAHALISAPICPLMSQPTHQCERADEALLGWPVEILEQAGPGWAWIKTRYGYTGYAPTNCLLDDAGQAARWAGLPRAMVAGGLCDVLNIPAVEGWRVDTLPRGALIALAGPPLDTGWQRVALPDGREGYTKSSFLSDDYKVPLGGQDPGGDRLLGPDLHELFPQRHYHLPGRPD